MLTADNICSTPCALQLFHLQPPVSAFSNKAGDKTNKKYALTSENHNLNNMVRRLYASHVVHPQSNPTLKSLLIFKQSLLWWKPWGRAAVLLTRDLSCLLYFSPSLIFQLYIIYINLY